MEIISLFAGCGGFDLGFRMAGFKVIWANEYDTAIHTTYRRNHPNVKLNTSDIRTLNISDIPNCDGIIGGPPCQSWSLGGKSLGLYDERGQLVYEYIRIIKGKHPKFFIMENVPGMVSPRHIGAFKVFLDLFRSAGYRVKFELINAADFSIPQDRLRVFIVGIRNDIGLEYNFPVASRKKRITLKQAIGNLLYPPRPYNKDFVKQGEEVIPNHDYYIGGFDGKFMARNRVRGWQELSYTIQAQAKNEPLHPQAPKMLYCSSDKRMFVPGHEKEYRRLSVRECARIQTFPDSFYFYYNNVKDGYKMVGNAVPPRLAFHLAKSIKDCFVGINYNVHNQILVGYIKNNNDLDLIRKRKIYYIRRGSRAGSMQYGQIEDSIKWLFLHHSDKKYMFELEKEQPTSCNGDFLRELGFSPQGNEYWIFYILRELDNNEIEKLLPKKKLRLTLYPYILKI